MRKRLWHCLAVPHPTFERLSLIWLSFLVGAYAQAGKLDTASFDDAVAFFAAITLALVLVLEALLFLLIGLVKLRDRRRVRRAA